MNRRGEENDTETMRRLSADLSRIAETLRKTSSPVPSKEIKAKKTSALPEDASAIFLRDTLSESDVGSEGFRIKTAQDIAPGEKIRFSVSFFAAEAKLKLEGEGVVRWAWKNAHRECLVGVEILTLSSVSHSLFTAWCRVRQPLTAIPKVIA